MNGEMNRTEITKILVCEFSKIGNIFGLRNIQIHSKRNITSIYLIGINALELEIDWHENALFMYVVRLIEGQIPNEDIIYKYDDGTWCRIYIDEVYQKKNPLYKSQDRTNSTFLMEIFQYYKNLINSNTLLLRPYFNINCNV